MELSNALGDINVEPGSAGEGDRFAVREALESLVLMLTPFTPHFFGGDVGGTGIFWRSAWR